MSALSIEIPKRVQRAVKVLEKDSSTLKSFLEKDSTILKCLSKWNDHLKSTPESETTFRTRQRAFRFIKHVYEHCQKQLCVIAMLAFPVTVAEKLLICVEEVVPLFKSCAHTKGQDSLHLSTVFARIC